MRFLKLVGILIVLWWWITLPVGAKEVDKNYFYQSQQEGEEVYGIEHFLEFKKCSSGVLLSPRLVVGDFRSPCLYLLISKEERAYLELGEDTEAAVARIGLSWVPVVIFVVEDIKRNFDQLSVARMIVHENRHLYQYQEFPEMSSLDRELDAWKMQINLLLGSLSYYMFSIEDLKNGNCTPNILDSECHLASVYLNSGDGGEFVDSVKELYGH